MYEPLDTPRPWARTPRPRGATLPSVSLRPDQALPLPLKLGLCIAFTAVTTVCLAWDTTLVQRLLLGSAAEPPPCTRVPGGVGAFVWCVRAGLRIVVLPNHAVSDWLRTYGSQAYNWLSGTVPDSSDTKFVGRAEREGMVAVRTCTRLQLQACEMVHAPEVSTSLSILCSDSCQALGLAVADAWPQLPPVSTAEAAQGAGQVLLAMGTGITQAWVLLCFLRGLAELWLLRDHGLQQRLQAHITLSPLPPPQTTGEINCKSQRKPRVVGEEWSPLRRRRSEGPSADAAVVTASLGRRWKLMDWWESKTTTGATPAPPPHTPGANGLRWRNEDTHSASRSPFISDSDGGLIADHVQAIYTQEAAGSRFGTTRARMSRERKAAAHEYLPGTTASPMSSTRHNQLRRGSRNRLDIRTLSMHGFSPSRFLERDADEASSARGGEASVGQQEESHVAELVAAAEQGREQWLALVCGLVVLTVAVVVAGVSSKSVAVNGSDGTTTPPSLSTSSLPRISPSRARATVELAFDSLASACSGTWSQFVNLTWRARP